MKIDSSMIGMESARSYTSVTKKAVSASLVSATVEQGSERENESFADLLNTGTGEEGLLDWEKQLAMDNPLKSRRTYRSVSSLQEKKTMQSIREQCVQFLIKWLYQSMGTGRNASQGAVTNAQNTGQQGSVIDEYVGDTSMTDSLSAGNSITLSQMKLDMSYYHAETEQTSFDTVGTVKTADGRELHFNLQLSMSRSFEEYYKTQTTGEFVQMTDPLVINLNTDMAALSDQKFAFDIDADGVKDSISMLESGSGYLALDQNGDGIINDGSELFGTKSGDGFADLSQYDEDHNGWIDENDAIFDKLMVWTKDENGKDELYTLKKSGIGAICVQRAETDFSLNSLKNNQTNGQIRSTGIFLYENGNVGTMQQLDLAR